MRLISLLVLAVSLVVGTASVALADEPAPASAPIVAPPAPTGSAELGPPNWGLPPCAPPEIDGKYRLSTGCSGVTGLRGATTSVRGTSAGTGAGLMFATEGQELVRRGLFSSRGFHRLAIGGGGAGFEGTLLGGVAGGFRIPFGERHGPVVRAGAQGWVLGNDAFYSSLLELPRVEAGYQYMRGTTVLELGATTGVVLAGRWRGGDAETRRLGRGFETGAYVVVQVPWLRLGASAMRLPTTDALQSPVDVGEVTLCMIHAPFAVCADARAMRADAFASGAASEVRAVHAGLTLGFTRER